MSKQIDERVVSMQFDNKHFEKNVETTMSTLDKLKQKLDLKGASKGLENVDAAAKKVDMSKLSDSVETVGLKFNALYSVADQALRNITNSAMMAGKKIVSALAIDPIKTGFQEYETQINAVQTILANTESKGTTLQQVNSALDTLNTYADKTIYNFTEMTRNIGTFTAAGVDLDTSVNAIQGIANLAAVSGSNAQQASTAMYQLSQALSSGTVKLMDWNSVVNAGMGGQVFQDALKETARNHGVAIDTMIKNNGSFRETLQEGWLTSEILTETLSHFTMAAEEGTEQWEAYKKSLMDDGYSAEQAEAIIRLSNTATNAATKVKTFTQLWDTLKESAQSGWTQTWEIVVGDFEEAKGFLTEISDKIGGMIGAMSDARNAVLSEGLSSGWKQLLDAGIADEEGYKETFNAVAKEHGMSIDEMIAAEKKLDTSLSDTEAYQKVLKKGFTEGTLSSNMLTESVHKMAEKMSEMSGEELKAAGYTADHVTQIKELSTGLKDGSVSMDEFVKKITRTSGRENLIQALWNSFNGLMSVIEPIKEAFGEVFKPLKGEQLYSFTEALVKFTEKLTISSETADKVKRTFKGVFSVINIGVQIIKGIVSGCVKLIGAILPVGDGLLSVTGSLGDFLSGVNESISKVNIFEGIFQKLADILGSVANGVKSVLSSLAFGVAECGGILGIIQKLIGLVGQLFDKITVASPGNSIFDTLFDLVNGGIFTAIGLWIAKIIKTLSNFTENAGDFLGSITGILEGVGDALDAFTGSIKAETLKKIAVSIGILAASLFVLSLIEPGKLTVALTAITTLFGELMISMKLFGKILDGNNFKGVGKVTIAMIGIATSLFILAGALKIMSTMSWNEMGVGLTSLVVGLGALIGTVWALPEKELADTSKAIRKLSTSLVILALAIKIMSTMSWQEMGVGLISMTVGLGALVGAVHLLPKDVDKKAGNLLILASAMVIFGAALKILASMSWQEMALSLGGMVIGLGALIGALHLLPKDAAGKAGSVLLLSTAMVVLGAALKILSSIPWQEMAVGLGGMAIGLGIFIGALWALPKDAAGKAATILLLSSAMVVLAAAFKILGSMSWESLGKGIASIAAVLVILGIAAYALSPVSGVLLAIGGAVALLGVGCIAAGAGLILISTGITALATAIVASAGIILAGANEIVGVFATIILSIVNAIVICIPAITNGLLQLLVSVLTGLVQYTPQLVNLLFDFVIGLINALAERLPDLIQAGVNLLMAFFQGVVDALGTVDTSVLIQGLAAVGLFAGLIIALSAIAPFIPGAMLAVLGMGALVVELGLVLAAIGALAQIPGLEWLISEGGDFLQKVGTAIGQFLGGIVGGFAQGVSSALPQIGADLSAFMINATPFIVGAKMIDSTMLESVKSLAEIILLLTGASILEGLTSWLTGGSSFVDFGKQLVEFGPYIAAFAKSVSGINPEAVSAAANAGKMLAEMADTIPSDWGNDNLTDFAGQFKEFGEDIVSFSNAVTGKISLEGLEIANKGSKLLIEIAEAIPGDWGGNNITNFANQLAPLGSALATFSTDVNGKTDSISTASVAIKGLIDTVSSITANSALAIDNFNVALVNIGQNGVDGFIKAFTNSYETVKSTVSDLLDKASNILTTKKNTVYNDFYDAGENAVDGFADGISENTFKAEAKAKAMAKAAYDAANKELDINSPSRKFRSIGGSVVEGFGQGITSNLEDVKKSANILGSTMLNATQKNLKINSPSVVFSKEVGRYVVQGIADGITKDMSAEEAAQKKAQNIVSAFQKEFDKSSIASSIAQKELELWSLGDGKKANINERAAKELEFYKGELSRNLSDQTLAYNEWQETAKEFGESSQETSKAWDKYLDAQIKVAKTQRTVSELNSSALTRDADELDKAMAIRDKNYEKWLKTKGKYASDSEIEDKELGKAAADLYNLNTQLAKANKEHEEAIANYAADSEEVYAAYNKCLNLEIAIADKNEEILAIRERRVQREIDSFDELINKRNDELALWEEQNENTASEAQVDAKRLRTLNDNLGTLNDKLIEAQRNYNEKVREFGKEHEEAKEAWDDVYQTQLDIAQTQNDITQITKNAIERQKDSLEMASDTANLQYQIWEKTVGKEATYAEKDVAKIGMLTKQLASQSSILNIARNEWAEAANTYGQYSNEAQSAYKEYLSQQLELANIQNEITDINEANAVRQKNAQSEYKKYIEKYEKYYTMNGMSKSDLERDAKLVTGYNPNSTVNTMIDKTNAALENVQDSPAYTSLMKNFTGLGTSYVDAVNAGVQSTLQDVVDSMSSMIDDCIKTIKDTQPEWVLAGKYVVTGFSSGIMANINQAVGAAIKLAADTMAAVKAELGIQSPSKAFANIGMFADMGLAKGLIDNANLSETAATKVGKGVINNLRDAIARISDVVNSDIDTQPTIRPVLDLTNVESGTAKLNTLFSRTQAIQISNGMSKDNVNGIQNGEVSANKGNSFNFVQNNYSPKALSRSEIYRQTKNQFAAMKGALS